MKKKNLLVYNRNGLSELDWILPVLFEFKKNYNIFFYFKSEECFKNITNNKIIFKLWKKIVTKYYIQTKKDFFILRSLRKILLWIFRKDNFYLINYINYKIHDFKNIYKKIDKKKFDFFFSEFDFHNPWIKCAIKNNIKVIHYPSSPKIFPNIKLKSYKPRYNLDGNLLILNSRFDYHYWKKLQIKPPIFISGYPKFDNHWIKKITQNKKILKDNSKCTFLYSYKYNFEFYTENQKKVIEKYINNVISIILSNKNNRIIFKLHPRTKFENLNRIIKNFSKDQIVISKKHLYELLMLSDYSLSEPLSSVFLDSLALKVPPIELFLNDILNIDKNLKLYSKLGIAIPTNDLKKFNKIINEKRKLALLGNKCVKNFFQIYKKDHNDAKKTYKYIISYFLNAK